MPQTPRIGEYRFGSIEIDGQTFSSDVIILPTQVHGNWWRGEGHLLKPADLTKVLEASPDVVIIGQGASGLMKVAPETHTCLMEAGIDVLCMPTAQAVEAYNERAARRENVAAALHLTC